MSELPTPPRRRWFQFGIGTMLVVVALFAVWLGWESRIFHARQEMLRQIEIEGGHTSDGRNTGSAHLKREGDGSTAIPYIRALMGDRFVNLVWFPVIELTPRQWEIVAHFPESRIIGNPPRRR